MQSYLLLYCLCVLLGLVGAITIYLVLRPKESIRERRVINFVIIDQWPDPGDVSGYGGNPSLPPDYPPKGGGSGVPVKPLLPSPSRLASHAQNPPPA